MRLLSTSTFRLALLYMALFAASVLLLLGFIYWNTAGFMARQTDETIAAETQGLAEQYQRFGLAGLMDTILARSQENPSGAALYLLTDRNLDPLLGNLPLSPTVTGSGEGWYEVAIPPEEDAPGSTRHARIRHFTLPGGFHLLVGRDVTQRKAVEALIVSSLFWGTGITLVLGLLGGMLMSRSVLRRIEQISRTSREIMRGDLSRRMPSRGVDDEFDQLSDSLNLMLDRIEDLLNSVRQVSDSIAHDLRSPLTRLRTRLEVALLSRDIDHRRVIEETMAETEAILSTFNALLKIAQAEAGLRREDLQLLDLGSIAADASELYQPLAEDKDIVLRTDLQSDARVLGNRHLLAQAVANLLDNAVKYTPSGGRVTVSASGNESPSLVVSDSGPGVPADRREKVLERFYRLEESRSSPGSGLGLSLVAAVARLHGAALTLEDNSPGLVVSLTFPPVTTR